MLTQTSSWTKMSFIAGTVLFVFVLCPSNVVSQGHRYTRCKWNVTKYGCPKFGDDSWGCLKGEARCPSNTEYHCARLSWNTNTFGDGCYENITCKEGEAPFIFNDWEIRCDWCSNPNRYNSEQRVSSTYSECEQKKVKCNVPNGIECQPAQETDKYKQNRRCRCDARRNYVMPNLQEYGKGEICTSDSFLASRCQPAVPCGKNQERLLNYTCVDKCINGYRPEDSDDCVPRIVTTSATDVSPPENSTKGSSSTSSSSSTTTLSSTLSTSKQTPFPVPKSTAAPNLGPNPKESPNKGSSVSTVTVLVSIIGVLVAVVLVLLAKVIRYKRKKKGSRKQSNNNGGALPLHDKKVSYEVRILVKKDWDFTAIEQAGPNIGSLEITQKLQRALQRELSSIPDILNVEVRDIRKGSLLVIYTIETKEEFKKSDLHACLYKISHKGNMGEFPVGHIRIIPSSRRESIIDITGETEGRFERRRSFKRSLSQMSTMSPSPSSSQLANGHAKPVPRAVLEEFEEAEPEERQPFLATVADDSGYTSPQKGELSYISEGRQTPRFGLGDTSPTTPFDQPSFSHHNGIYTPYKSSNKNRSLSAYPKQTLTKNDTTDNNGACFISIEDGHAKSLDRKKMYTKNSPYSKGEKHGKLMEKQQRQQNFTRMRRISSSHNDISAQSQVTEQQEKQKHVSQQFLPSDPDKRDEIAKMVLRKHYDDLLSNLQPDRILDKFIIYNFLNERDIRDIREKKDTSEKNRCIIATVESRGFEGFRILREIIRSIQLELSKLDEDYMEIAMAYEAAKKDKESESNDSTDEEKDEENDEGT